MRSVQWHNLALFVATYGVALLLGALMHVGAFKVAALYACGAFAPMFIVKMGWMYRLPFEKKSFWIEHAGDDSEQ